MMTSDRLSDANRMLIEDAYSANLGSGADLALQGKLLNLTTLLFWSPDG